MYKCDNPNALKFTTVTANNCEYYRVFATS